MAVSAGQTDRWQSARILQLQPLTGNILRVRLQLQQPRQARAGQHVDIRLTADDGYQAQRSYSLLSPPGDDDVIELGVERITDGEVSGWLHDIAEVGDEVELLGPIGGHFVWDAQHPTPALLIGGGSGVVPLLSIAAHHHAQHGNTAMTLVAASRLRSEVVLAPSLQTWAQANPQFRYQLALSRETVVSEPHQQAGHIDLALLAGAIEAMAVAKDQLICYLCGSNRFVEAMVPLLRQLGINDSAIRTERFGDAVS
ncbi:FAD-binding oxidoreductase [Pseudoxanthomonas dokdonensis]|uniref:FAD-binding FR-type domain-containing protein n=1 Tax=Pseudoxanthomonas dokdonensis TaxID=344882 RepID=A0A0R0CHS5_9GAMM|nr:FAD-binding oxidoreductase [Pseudoxanthomonas dokdonensis]KRG69024.1 hypothetical protein ABB29_11340 [Pseudoxanthomonas dokdonensis]